MDRFVTRWELVEGKPKFFVKDIITGKEEEYFEDFSCSCKDGDLQNLTLEEACEEFAKGQQDLLNYEAESESELQFILEEYFS